MKNNIVNVIIEGPDKSGKSSLIKDIYAVAELKQNIRVKTVEFPTKKFREELKRVNYNFDNMTHTQIFKLIDGFIKDMENYYTELLKEESNKLTPLILIWSRSFISSIVYQGYTLHELFRENGDVSTEALAKRLIAITGMVSSAISKSPVLSTLSPRNTLIYALLNIIPKTRWLLNVNDNNQNFDDVMENKMKEIADTYKVLYTEKIVENYLKLPIQYKFTSLNSTFHRANAVSTFMKETLTTITEDIDKLLFN